MAYCLLFLQTPFVFSCGYNHSPSNKYSPCMKQAGMVENEQRLKQMQKQWDQLPDRPIQGKLSHYKINKNIFLGRGGFGIVYAGLRRTLILGTTDKFTYQQVAIKEFKKSERWKEQGDQDKEVLLLSKFGSMLDSNFVLQVVEIFQEKQSMRYFLITPYAKGGNLIDRIMRWRTEEANKGPSEEDIYQFALRMAKILHYIHYQALSNFRSKQGGGEQRKQKMGIIHRDVKPQNIVFLSKDGKDMKDVYLLDFGVAKVGYSQYVKGYNNCGTSYYKAPEIGEGRVYNAKVDIYSFGCTLFQVINDGQKLITTAGIGTRYGDRQRFIKSKLIDLHLKLLKSEKFKSPGYWVRVLNDCLAYDVKKRHTSEDLVDFLSNNHYGRFANDDRAPFYGTLADKQREAKFKREIFQVSFQIFRLSVIQDVIFSVFEYVYFEQPRIIRFTMYTLLKFIIEYFLERYQRLKERVKLVDKGPQLRAAIESGKIKELREKCHDKMRKELQREKNNDLMQNRKTPGPNQDVVKRYPQLMHVDISEPKRILYQFCYQKKVELLQNQKFARLILTVICYMQDFDYYQQLRIQNADLENFDVEVLSVKRLHLLKKSVEERLIKDGLKNKLDCCRVEGSLKSNINKEENKTDVDIELKIA